MIVLVTGLLRDLPQPAWCDALMRAGGEAVDGRHGRMTVRLLHPNADGPGTAGNPATQADGFPRGQASDY